LGDNFFSSLAKTDFKEISSRAKKVGIATLLKPPQQDSSEMESWDSLLRYSALISAVRGSFFSAALLHVKKSPDR
jgi:hypothetical protein